MTMPGNGGERTEVAEALIKTHDTAPETLDRASSSGKAWQTFYSRGVLASDLVVLVVTSIVAQFLRFGFGSDVRARGPFSVDYTELGLALAFMWWVSLQVFQTRDRRILGGEDFTEYSRVIRATVLFFGSFATFALIFKWDMSRGFLAIVLPLGLVGLLVERKVWRVWLRSNRRRGEHISNVLIIGGQQSARKIATAFTQHRDAGLRVTGVWVP